MEPIRKEVEIDTNGLSFEEAKDKVIEQVEGRFKEIEEIEMKRDGFSKEHLDAAKEKTQAEAVAQMKAHYTRLAIQNAVEPVVKEFGLATFAGVYTDENGTGVTFYVSDEIKEISNFAATSTLKASLKEILETL